MMSRIRAHSIRSRSRHLPAEMPLAFQLKADGTASAAPARPERQLGLMQLRRGTLQVRQDFRAGSAIRTRACN
jgi:hypothetical protein